jgi:TP901 family phage tail tape measure protein
MFGLGSSTQLGIGIAVRLHDQFSAQAIRINNTLTQMRKNSTSALNTAVNSYRNQAATIAAGAGLIGMGMYRMAEGGAEYQHIINKVAIVGGKDLNKSRADLTKFANTLSQTFTTTPEQIANAMYENVKSGVTGGLEEITRYQAAVATATGEALEGSEGVAEKLLGIMNAMGMSYKEFPRIANATTAVANATISNVTDIGEAMQYAANTAHLAGLSLEQTLTLVGKLSMAKVTGSAAGTAIGNMIDMLQQAVGPMAAPKKTKALRYMGINPQAIRALMNEGRAMEALEAVDAAARKLPRNDQNAMLKELFNRRGGRGIINAFMAGNKTMQDIRTSAEKGIVGDIAPTQARAMANDLYGEMHLLTNSFHTFRASFVEAVGPTFRVVLAGLAKGLGLVSAFLNTPIGKVMAGLVAVVIPVIAIMFGFRAALLTATIALRGFGALSAVGGFGGLMSGGLGAAGMAGMGALGGLIRKNSLGRYAVAAGQTVTMGGKLYTGGQLLPRAGLAAMGIGGAARGAGLVSKAAGFFGAAGPWITRGLGFMGRMLPIVGAVWTVVDILNIMKDMQAGDEAKTKALDPFTSEYYRNIDLMYMNKTMNKDWYNKAKMSKKEEDRLHMNQNFQVNIDGVSQVAQTMNAVVAMDAMKDLNNKFDFEMPEINP